jgi:ADP-ribose pyrophosphatase YjhB (NUDIX family)
MALHHQLVGWAAGVYWRLVRPRTLGVCALVLDPDGRVVLVRQTYRRGWHLPGGGVHRFEPFHDALARELREEIGVDRFALERLLGVYQNRSEGKDDRVLVFVARVEAEAAAAARPADRFEIAELGWFAPDALPQAVSPATARRVGELGAAGPIVGDW